MTTLTLTVDGKEYVAIPKEEYARLIQTPRVPYPQPNERGNFPAVEYSVASIANEIIDRREALGWSQRELARRAGMRFETLNRIERGSVTPETKTIIKIDTALKAGEKQR